MNTIPCPLCGYHAPGIACPHCALTANEPSLVAARTRFTSDLRDGVRALPIGLWLLASTPRIKRLLIPPVVLTGLTFGVVFFWIWSAISRLLEAARQHSIEALGLREGWLKVFAGWLLERGVVIALAKASGVVIFLVIGSLLALWTFSIAYEAIAGPFLDAIQGRIETLWFGRDPWKSVERPNAIAPKRRVRLSIAAAIPALAAIAAWWFGATRHAWVWLLLAPVPFIAIGFVARDWGEWLAWAIGAQLRTLFVSFKASAFAGFALVLFFWVKFIPFVGYFLFAGLAGFCTAISLLDIPFSRRRWSLRQRLRFMVDNAPAVVAFGVMTSFLFVIPFVGPLIGVPAASIGGQWLLCRLDKSSMRPKELRIVR